MRKHVIKAIFRRDFSAYFSGPAGYVFISLFIVASAIANFAYQDAFFRSNLANLNQLSQAMPYLLLFFIPAITMNIWAEERKQGTDALLFTLPAKDLDIVLGKYLASLGIYTVALFFSLSNVIFLWVLGQPDFGLIFGTFVGYWLMGGMLLAAGMVGSLLSTNATVGFILGALISTSLIIVPDLIGFDAWTVGARFRNFGEGLVSFGNIAYFVSLTTFMLFLNVVLVSKRHWSGGKQGSSMSLHYVVRALAVVTCAICLSILTDRAGARVDVTAEQIHSISDTTREQLDSLDAEKPVIVRAFISPDVPQGYIQRRLELISTLEQFDSIGGNAVDLEIIETEAYSEEAREAEETYKITPREVAESKGGHSSSSTVFLGVVLTSGLEQDVIPFFSLGLSVEYELLRSVRVVTQTEKKKLGVLETDLPLMVKPGDQSGGRDWQVIEELRKQYEVISVAADTDYPGDLDALLAVLPSSLTQSEMTRLEDYILAGNGVVILEDPLPVVAPFLSPNQQKLPPQNNSPFAPPQEPEPKGNISGLMSKVGLRFVKDRVVWDDYNPHPDLENAAVKHYFTFLGDNPLWQHMRGENEAPIPAFNPDHRISSGLQEMLFFDCGEFGSVAGNGMLKVTPLAVTGPVGGLLYWSDIVVPPDNIFNHRHRIKEASLYVRDQGYHVVAARVGGQFASSVKSDEDSSAGKANLAVVADIDFISDLFFNIRREGHPDYKFDNVTFFLNCIDDVIGDTRFIDVRKRRPKHRTLERIEDEKLEFRIKLLEDEEKADNDSEKKLEEARKRLNEAKKAIQEREGIDELEKRQLEKIVGAAEQRKFDTAKEEIELERKKAKKRAKEDMEQSIASIQNIYKYLAIGIPPIPAIFIGILVLLRRRTREYETVSEKRLL